MGQDIAIKGVILGVGYGAAVMFFLLWRGAEKDVLAERLSCNVDELNETIEAQAATMEAQQAAAARELEAERRLRVAAELARAAVADSASRMSEQVVSQRERISELELEADIDEIPDFADCSIVYVPGRVLYAEDCTAADPGRGYDYRVCIGPEGLNPADTAFTDITVGDSLKLWGADRKALGLCNAQLEEIEKLGEAVQ